MNTAKIEDLAYLINQAKQEGLPKPIVFLGAGASKSGGVPLASEIIDDILIRYVDKPNIKNLCEDEKTYPNLMACLTPFERNKLLKQYIEDAKINVTHIYLAQLIINGYIDYVLTVNFDNLLLRALALFNEFPPTYDMAILKDLTTTSFKEKSVVYLHGQHHGLWLLNTREEMAKVDELIPPILSSIKNQRAWIFIGYSGEDPIFQHVTKLGRFDNGLYWVSYNQNRPCDKVCNNLLEKENTNAFVIEGYDSDSFMLQLNSELKLPQPAIIDAPFTSLLATLQNIVDIEDKEHFKGVKERLEIVKKDVKLAIQQFEKGEFLENKTLRNTVDKSLVQKEIIDAIISKNFNQEKISAIEKKTDLLKDPAIKSTLADYYGAWANEISRRALPAKDEKLYKESFEKSKKASKLDPTNYLVYNNWAAALYDYAKIDDKASSYIEAISKCKRAIAIDDSQGAAYLNWAYVLRAQAIQNNDEQMYLKSLEKFTSSYERDPENSICLIVWGETLEEIGSLKNDAKFYKQSIEKYKEAITIDSNNDRTYTSYGTTLVHLAKLQKESILFEEAFEQFKIAVSLNPKKPEILESWGVSLSEYAKTYGKPESFHDAHKLLTTAVNLGKSPYNLACLYALQNDRINALALLEKSLKNNDVTIQIVQSDTDWEEFINDEDYKSIIKKYVA